MKNNLYDYEILKTNNANEILIVRRKLDNLIFGIGDEIKHYGRQLCKIISFKISDNTVVYNYLILDKDFPEELAQRWTKHFSAISNINEVFKISKENQIAFDKWWKKENTKRSKLPRFKLKINYPNSPFVKGQITSPFNDKFEINTELVKYYQSYPDCFEQI